MSGRLRYEDLPPGRLRDAVGRAIRSHPSGAGVTFGPESGGALSHPSAAARSPRPESRGRAHNRWTCATCGVVFTAWAPAERHADTHGGARLDLALEAVT